MIRQRPSKSNPAPNQPDSSRNRAETKVSKGSPAMRDGPSSSSRSSPHPEPPVDSPRRKRTNWLVLAVASGGCAAFNGVFAKLTTTELTARIAAGVAGLLGLSAHVGVLEAILRAAFFGLNLIFNGVMWTLFTAALSRGNSTTQVSIVNTSSNFVITALLGSAVFSEKLPPLWWVGAALLVVGNVIVGRKDESAKEVLEDEHGGEEESVRLVGGDERGKFDEDFADIGDVGDAR